MVEGMTLAGLAQGHRSSTRFRGNVGCTSPARDARGGSGAIHSCFDSLFPP